VTASLARLAAQHYVEAVNAADLDRISSLFTPDAVLDHFFGTYEGVDAIADFYRDVVLTSETSVTISAEVTHGDTCRVELKGQSPYSPDLVHVVDVFTVDERGLITRLEVYAR
jgi:ketosteroid isomerase-like protein